MTFTLENLQPESFSSNQTWLDFLTALTEVIEEQIRGPIRQLEDIRHFVEGTDPFVLHETIKMLGFDLPADIIKHNSERLSRSIYMLSMFHEISGVEGFERSIEYVLGRQIIVREKWTNNYADFYTTPQGPLLADGGDWYQTTHISLGMELVSGDRSLVLPINKTLQDRLLDAYFEFAPINQVVDDFFFIQKVQANLFLSGSVYINPLRRKTFGGGVDQVQQIVARGPQTVFSLKSAQFFADIMMGPNPCFDTSYIQFGQAATALTDADISLLQEVSNDLTEFVVNNTSDYLWFAVPAELGAVTFTDVNGFIGGWDGAGWEDGEIGTTSGPVNVQREIDGQVRSWNVYRTDFPALGNYTFYVSYTFNRDNSCDIVDPIVTEPPGPIDPPDCTTTTIDLYPVYDAGPHGIVTGSGIAALGQTQNTTSNFQFTLDLTTGYGYFSYPTALGLATFIDTNTFEGGWDGASWAEGSTGDQPGEHYGPITVTRDVSGNLVSYYIYRTDFPDVGVFTWNVSFQNPGLALSVTNTDCVSGSCVSGYPVLAEGAAELNTDSEIVANTVETFTSTNNFQFVADSASYSYLCYPIELGLATFTDSDDFVGGWDGASWLTGEIGSTLGPIIISRNVDGVVSDWYLYRTDFEGIAKTYDVVFANPGACVSTADPSCYVSGFPRYGSGFELHTGAHIDGLTPLPSTAPTLFNLVVNTGQYGYFASPAALGIVTFTDSLGIQGGWDGARWPHGSIGNDAGPTLVWRNISGELVPWYLYRTDFPALGATSYAVSYERDLDLGDTAVCNVGIPLASDFITGTPPLPVSFPIYGIGPIGIDNDYELSQLTNTFTNNSNQVFNLNVPAGQYGYFAHPSNLGIARFTDENDFEGGWDGASWPTIGSIGSENGPIAILRNIGGTVQTWYLYRTDFPGVGNKQYTVSFGHAEEDNGYRIIRVVEPVWSTDRPDLVVFDDLGVATFNRVFTDTIVHITATYGSLSDTIAVLLKADMPNVLTMTMLGMDEVFGGHNAVYGLEGHFDDGYVRPVDGAVYKVLSPYARFVNNTLFTDNPPADTILFLQATYVNDDGITIVATKEVMLKRVITELHVLQVSITGPSIILEGNSEQYVANVQYSNGTSQQENVVWSSSAAGLYINTVGLATAGTPLANFQATITAQFQFKGIVYEATKIVNVATLNMVAISLQIFGQNTIRELSSGQFSAVVSWSNGTTTISDAQWVTSKFSISEDGVLQTGSVGGTTSLSLLARAEGLSATKVVTVYNTPVLLEHIAIIGPNSVNEGEYITYRIFAHYSDNKDIEITASLYVEGNPPHITISGTTLSFTNSPTSMVELVAVYNDGVRDYIARKQIVLVNTVVTLAGLSILGPSEVLESKRIALAAIALYSDGTEDIVEPIWTVRNQDAINEPETHADIVSPGVVQGRLVTEDKTVIVEARYFTQMIQYPVIVRDYTPPGPDVPVSYYISGPDEITVNQVGSYALICQFENCPAEIMLSNDWALDTTIDVAILDSNGFLRSMNKQPAIVTVTATWSYNGHDIQATKVVHINNAIIINALLVNGPANVPEQSVSTFTAEYFYSNEVPTPGAGHLPDAGQVTWAVTGSPLATINNAGVMTMGDVDLNTPLTVTATYTNGSIVLMASIGVLVAGAPPPVINHNLIGGNSVLEGNSLTFVVEVFRQGMTQTPGTGIVVSPATMVYAVTQGTIVNGVFTAPQVNADTTVTLTITGQYETYPFSITHQIAVINKTPIDMLFTGPSSITAGTTGQYTAEVFVTGQPIVPGTGSSAGVVYSLVNAPAGVTINSTGLVTVDTTVDDVSFNVTATSGSITRSIAVIVPGVPLFTSIKEIKRMDFDRYNLRMTPRNYAVTGRAEDIAGEVYLWQTNAVGVAGTEYRMASYSLSNILNGSDTEVPTAVLDVDPSIEQFNIHSKHRDTYFFCNTGQVAGAVSLLKHVRSGNTFTTTTVIPDLKFPTLLGYTLTSQQVVSHRTMILADNTELLLVFMSNQTTYNGRPAGFGSISVYKLVAGTYTKIQDITDPVGMPATLNYHSEGGGVYYGSFMLRAGIQQGGDTIDCTWQTNPQNFGASRGIRTLYKFDGTQFNVLHRGLSSATGYMDAQFFNVAGKTLLISHIVALNDSSAGYTQGVAIHELVGTSLNLVQTLAQANVIRVMGSYAGAIDPLSIKISKHLMVMITNPTSNVKGVVRIYAINPTTGNMTLRLTVDSGALGVPLSSISFIREAFFLEDGKVIGLLADAAPTHKLFLLRG